MNIFNKKKKIVLYSLIVVAVGLIIGGLAWAYFAATNSTDDNSTEDTLKVVGSSETVCKDDLLKQADSAISDGNQADTQRLAGEVKTLPDYNKDPNCLYITLSERLSVSDASASRDYFDDMEPLVRANNGFSQMFILSSPSLDTLRSAVVALESNQEQLDKQLEANGKSFQDLDAVDQANSLGDE